MNFAGVVLLSLLLFPERTLSASPYCHEGGCTCPGADARMSGSPGGNPACDECIESCQGLSSCCQGTGCICESQCKYTGGPEYSCAHLDGDWKLKTSRDCSNPYIPCKKREVCCPASCETAIPSEKVCGYCSKEYEDAGCPEPKIRENLTPTMPPLPEEHWYDGNAGYSEFCATERTAWLSCINSQLCLRQYRCQIGAGAPCPPHPCDKAKTWTRLRSRCLDFEADLCEFAYCCGAVCQTEAAALVDCTVDMQNQAFRTNLGEELDSSKMCKKDPTLCAKSSNPCLNCSEYDHVDFQSFNTDGAAITARCYLFIATALVTTAIVML